MGEVITLAIQLVRLAHDLLTGDETPAGAHRRVREILPEKSESEKAAEEIERVTRSYSSLMDKLVNELDDPGEVKS